MFKHHSTRRVFAATLLTLSSAVSLSAFAGPLPRTNSFNAVMAVKDPSHFGPHLPAADVPSTYVAPRPGSIAAIMSTKDPAHYGPHLAATNQPIQTGRFPPRPGSFEAIILAKDPMFFKRGTASDKPQN